ncbi:unnamed protein product [Fraxinus pennsylvanica]|uniref:Transcription factor n=1 Tax=Fraxinus pennsylvanica TaxID=56036 RepID=A0AAD2AAG3_9LAMI|nr:unnamed protein product [Fraxinus pennsylvanica]
MMEALPSTNNSDSDCQTPKKRGRNPSVVCPNVPFIKNVDVERQRRKTLKNSFCELQSVVPYASKMDRAFLLSAAVFYIKELKEKVEESEYKRMKMEQLEIEMKIVGKNFLQINIGELKSNEFSICGYKWYMLIQMQSPNSPSHLSLCLCVADHGKLLQGWDN